LHTHLVVVLVNRLDHPTERLLQHARSLGTADVIAVHVTYDAMDANQLAATWMNSLFGSIPMYLLDQQDGIAATIGGHIRGRLDDGWKYVTVLIGITAGRRHLATQLTDTLRPLRSVYVAQAVV
jgi:hypothetical protein